MQLNSSFSSVEQAVLKTLIYSDIFNFPLTREELWKFLISDQKIKQEEFEKALSILIKVSRVTRISQVPRAFYCLSGRETIIHKRKKNLAEVEKKLAIAKKAASYLSLIPTIKFIGISGGLAIGNVEKHDDIDFFIITKKNTLFTTRFLVTLFLEVLNLRRRRNDKNPANKICANLLIDEDNLSWPVKMRDLYTAHEIIQVQPLFQRNGIYVKFIKANDWIKKYFINWKLEIKNRKLDKEVRRVKKQTSIIEVLMQKMQENYMEKHKTTEVVSKGFIAFHPKNYRTKTLSILRSKCQNLGLLTNF